MSSAPGDNQSNGGLIEVKCGPLLNYRHLDHPHSQAPTWHGSVLLVTARGQAPPSLKLQCLGPADSNANAAASSTADARTFHPQKLYEEAKGCFWRFLIDLPVQSFEAKWQYSIPNLKFPSGEKTEGDATRSFYVQAAKDSPRIMFHSCNGFSLGTDVEEWSGCVLWNDVLRKHQARPIHVMIGGGDQIYNDNIRSEGPLREWCEIKNPIKRREYDFSDDLRAKCDEHYFSNYARWYMTEPFANANGCIPQINIWDDHDIIDGFGSYNDHFNKCAVFRGIGTIAHKYYLLYQHHVAPPHSPLVADAPSDHHATNAHEQQQQKDAYYLTGDQEDPCYVLGKRPGPYIAQRSRNMFTQLGAHMAFMSIDARTERMRHQINYEDTYDLIFDHADKQLEATGGRTKHLILLLGVPIAYPRLQWLENILSSPAMGAVRFLSKRFGVASGLFNTFDGGIDLLDDLDDHYTAHQHKKERKELILRLQTLASKHSVRITILGGDVHLCAFGRFYSHPSLNMPLEKDYRYMANIVSSAITNHPPPQAVANLLARRNKIHHLDHHTDETLLDLFDKDPSTFAPKGKTVKPKAANFNHCTMPSRNFAFISTSNPEAAAQQASTSNGQANVNGDASNNEKGSQSREKFNPRSALGPGELEFGTQHPAVNAATTAASGSGRAGAFGLDVVFHVEIDNHDREGHTVSYGLSIPSLEMTAQEREAAQHHGLRDDVRRKVEEAKDHVHKHGDGAAEARPASAPAPKANKAVASAA